MSAVSAPAFTRREGVGADMCWCRQMLVLTCAWPRPIYDIRLYGGCARATSRVGVAAKETLRQQELAKHSALSTSTTSTSTVTPLSSPSSWAWAKSDRLAHLSAAMAPIQLPSEELDLAQCFSGEQHLVYVWLASVHRCILIVPGLGKLYTRLFAPLNLRRDASSCKSSCARMRTWRC
jgi:hypothetical protein